MKVDGLKVSDVDFKNDKALTWFFWSKGALTGEGQRILKKYPQYESLKNDWDVKSDNDLYIAVVYAYMVDTILKKEKDNDFILEKHKQSYEWTYCKNPKDLFDVSRKRADVEFLIQYEDYLIEQKHPGIHERAQKEREKKAEESAKRVEALRIQNKTKQLQERYQLQQDLAAGTRVICPYCKSADTKKLTALNRAVSVSLVGAASGKIGKQWHCNHCGSDF